MRPVDLPLVSLVVTPERYDGQHVRVIGFLTVRFEITAIYPHAHDFLIGATRNGIWAAVDLDRTELHQTYVVLEGTFRADDHGHMAAYSGAIRDVTRLELRQIFASVLANERAILSDLISN